MWIFCAGLSVKNQGTRGRVAEPQLRRTGPGVSPVRPPLYTAPWFTLPPPGAVGPPFHRSGFVSAHGPHRPDLEREFKVVSSRLSFGLNFERHHPEAVVAKVADKLRVLDLTRDDVRKVIAAATSAGAIYASG
jgi:hypothetical protein